MSANPGRLVSGPPVTVRLLVALALLGVLAGGLPGRPGPAAAASSDVVVLVDGLCSRLAGGEAIPGTFTGPDGLADRLRSAGWPDGSIVAFGYNGGAVAPDGSWSPAPWDCAHSRDQGLVRDVELFAAQVTALAQARPGTAFHLIGFSLGGLVAFAYVARLAIEDGWELPGGARIATLVTLDAPLGGLPFVDQLCGFAPDECGGTPVPAPGSALRDMSAIWETGDGRPAGGDRSVAALVAGDPSANQAVAVTAATDHGVAVLTLGNVRDWLYAPLGPDGGTFAFPDTQWLTSGPADSGVYARAIDSGPPACPASNGSLAAAFGCNHNLVVRDAAAGQAILDVMAGAAPLISASCPAGKGGCLALPPRPATVMSSAATAGIVKTGGRFTTSAVAVPDGGRATVRFGTSPAVAGARMEIWSRTATGVFRYLTARLADASGVVRYFTPPISARTVFQARFPGDFVHGPGVSPGRVVTVR